MAVTWKFVDRPESGATVLLDMSNGADWWLSGEGFDVSPPPRRRSIAKNNMGDGALVTANSYELRELRFTVELRGETEADRNAQLKALEAELDKPTNLLMYTPERGTVPVFFQTLAGDCVIDMQLVPGKRWEVSCVIPAQPFAIGERHDVVTGAVVTNNPASGTNRLLLDITDVRGDVPAPAFARIGSGFGAGATFAVAQRTQNNPTAVTVFAQSEAGTLGTDTTTQPNDAAMSGAGNNFTRTTFATNTLITRVTVTVPTATSAEALRGKYRVFVKVRRSAATSAFTMRYMVPGATSVIGPTVTYDTSLPNGAWMMDLGTVELPSPGPVPAGIGYSGLPAGFAQPTLEIQARRDTGALSLDMDYVVLLPADERLCSFRQVASMGYTVLDGPNDMTYGMAAGTSPFGGSVATRTIDNNGGLVARIGGLPVLVPGVTNRWHILRCNQDATLSSTWDVSYWPNWLEVATS